MASALLTLGAWCGAIVIILSAIAAISRLKPVQWVWRQLISGPLERFSTRIVKDGAGQFHEEIVAPQIAQIAAKVDELVEQGETSWHKDKSWIHGRLLKVEERQKQLLLGITTALTAGDDSDDVRDLIVGAMTVMLEDFDATRGQP